MPGIKVDTGAKDLAGSSGETVTEGLDGLRERLAEYVELGARFTKWRATIAIGDHIPTPYCLDVNAHALARFAALSQEAGSGSHGGAGSAHGRRPLHRPLLRRHRSSPGGDVSPASRQGVALDGILLKTNMVLSGASADGRAGPEEVAKYTVACLKSAVPASVPGIVFLSGGQADDEATTNLDAINRHAQRVRRSLGTQLLLRPRPPGRTPQGLGGQQRQPRRSPKRLPPPRQSHRRRPPGPLRPPAWRRGRIIGFTGSKVMRSMSVYSSNAGTVTQGDFPKKSREGRRTPSRLSRFPWLDLK